MIDNLFLPYPKSFAKYCTYSLDESVPVWFSGCTKQNSNLFFSDLFGNSLEYKNLDKASANAINEFAINIIDTEHLFNDLEAPSIDTSLVSIIDYKPIVDCLKRNNLLLLSDLKEFGLENILRIQKMGIKKALYVFIAIAEFNESLLNDVTLVSDEEDLSDEEVFSIINKYSHELPLDSIYLFDPRFRAIYQNCLAKFDLEVFDYPSWNDFFMNGEFPSNLLKISAIKQFSDDFKLLNTLSLEEQMSHFFTEYIKSSSKQLYIDRNLESFSNIRDRLGIKESIDEIHTLQKTAKSFPKPVTRERVRQLLNQHLQALNSIPDNEEILIPKLSDVLKILQKNTNKSLSDISHLLSKKGYGEWNIQRLIDCFELFRLPNQLTINGDFLNDKSMVKANNYILKIAKKIINYNGAVNTNQINSAVNSVFPIDREDLLTLLRGAFEEVGHDWFFIETGSNLLIDNLGQKIANFSLSFSLQSLREAHMKNKKLREPGHYKRRGEYFYGFLTPPSSVIERVMNLSSNYYVEDGSVICTNLDNKFVEDHSSADYQFLQYFRARNFDCATFDEMKDYFIVQSKMPEGSFLQYTTYRPYLKRIGRSIYGIVGKDYDTASYENARDRIKDTVPTKIEWIEGGIEIKERLKLVGSCTIRINPYDQYLTSNEFKIFYDGKEYYSIKKGKSSFLYGIGPYLSDVLFCEIGDFIRISLDLEKNEAKVELISEDEFEN